MMLEELERSAAGHWIPLMDYSIRKGVSLSTLRRYIKANKVQYKVENGRYLLFDGEKDRQPVGAIAHPNGVGDFRSSTGDSHLNSNLNHEFQLKLQKLETDLRKANEEIAELRMLVALYEEKMGSVPRFDS